MKAAFIALVCLPVIAQAPYSTSISASDVAIELPANTGAAGLWQSLKKLHTRASLIMITAHPDDEDGGMLTYESRGQGARVALLTLNRGEGGANVMSSDYFDALGLVRTEELLAADRYYGVDQYWTRVVDYGFSKTMDESLSKWTRDRVLYDVVRVVRTVRPLVVTSVFVGGPSDGHGNHQTAGLMAKEVYRLAGDPTVFPGADQSRSEALESFEGLRTRAIFAARRHKSVSRKCRNSRGQLRPVPGSELSPVFARGAGTSKIAERRHRYPRRGPADERHYHRFDSRVTAEEKEQSFFDGIDTSLAGIASLAKQGDSAFLVDGLKQINADVEQALGQFSAAEPDKVAPFLARGMKGTIALLDRLSRSNLSEDAKFDIAHELNIKRAQFNTALVEALGIAVRATVAPATERDPRAAMFVGEPDTFRLAIPGQTFGVKVQVVNQSSVPASLRGVSLKAAEPKSWSISDGKPADGNLPPNQLVTAAFRATVAADAGYTRPYFSRPNIEQPYYDILDERYLNLPRSPYPLAASAEMTFDGAPLEVIQVVQTVQQVPGSGQVLEPLGVGPAISVAISPRAGVVPLDSKTFPVAVVVHSNVKGPAKGVVRLELPSGWRSMPESAEFSAAQDGEDHSIAFQVSPVKLAEKSYEITAVAGYLGGTYREGYQVTGYNGLRPYFLYMPSTYRTVGVDVKVAPGLKVGYIMGSGDDVPASLEQLGIRVNFLTAVDLAGGDLSKYDAILLGVRTYAVRDDLRTYNNRLLDYVRNGGVVIVEYNTPEYDHNYGPYPYVMGNNPEEVTDEASKIDILAPSNPVFSWPNKITDNDFHGWVEERGSKWMQSWDSHYEALLSTHDAGQPPQKGGLLYAKYGKGIYIYNAYAFYRQLPEGVPGAYRIFANMLSLPKNPAR